VLKTEDETPEVEYAEPGGFFALIEQMIVSARADLNHVHSRETCSETSLHLKVGRHISDRPLAARCDIRETAEQFLKDLRTGQAGIGSQWVDLASMSLGNSRFLTDDETRPQPPPQRPLPESPRLREKTIPRRKGFAIVFDRVSMSGMVAPAPRESSR